MVFPMKFQHLYFGAATYPKYDIVYPAIKSECPFNDFNIYSRLLCTTIIAQIFQYCRLHIVWSRTFTVNPMLYLLYFSSLMTYPFIFENISTMSYVFLHLQYYFMLLDYDSLTYRVCYFSLILQGLLQIQQGSNVIFEFLSYIHEENG
jgi:hypothetical protein